MEKSKEKECKNCGISLSLDSFYDKDEMCKWCLFSYEIRKAIYKRTPICVECHHELLATISINVGKWDTKKKYFVDNKKDSEGAKHMCHVEGCNCNFYLYGKKSRFVGN